MAFSHFIQYNMNFILERSQPSAAIALVYLIHHSLLIIIEYIIHSEASLSQRGRLMSGRDLASEVTRGQHRWQY